MSVWSLPVRRPVATTMFFTAVLLLGLIAWWRIPIELLPAVEGDYLFVQFGRPGSEPELIEREILLPLSGRSSALAGVEETWGEITGSTGTFTIRFAPGTDLRVRELELRRVTAELSREQPPGGFVIVETQDLGDISRFVMSIQVVGMEDRNSLVDLAEQRLQPRLAAVPGVSRVAVIGGATREMTVEIDPDRLAAVGVSPQTVTSALVRSVQRLRYLGGVEDERGRTAVVLDGRPRGPISLANTRISNDPPVVLGHVADVRMGGGREDMLFQIDGRPSVAMILFKDEGANLVQLGRASRARLDELREEFAAHGLDFVINFDAAEMVEKELRRLQQLAGSGFLIALAVLFLFLRQWRGVGVVAVAVPASLLAALALLFLAGQSLNLITLFGLAVGVGMLVDNSIVVYEAVQRQLEHGVEPDTAATEGVRRTVRAIAAATATNAVVFFPVAFLDLGDSVTRSLLVVLSLAILLPLLGSLVVAVGLVPLLARRLAAPAALGRLALLRRRHEAMAGRVPPNRPRELFAGTLSAALRRPSGWVTFVILAVLLTVIIAMPWVGFQTATAESSETEAVRLAVRIDSGSSLDRARELFGRLETAAGDIEGVKHVESFIREDGGAITVHLLPLDERPEGLDAGDVREAVRQAAQGVSGLELENQGSGGGGGGGGREGGGLQGLLGQGSAKIVLSGPDASRLEDLAQELETRLESIPEIASATVDAQRGPDEIRVLPEARALESFGLTADQVLPVLDVMRRDGVLMRTGFTLPGGREIPLTVRRARDENLRASNELRNLRLSTPAGVVALGTVASVHRMPPPPTVRHHDGRRELSVAYTFSPKAPTTGPARQRLEEQVREEIQAVHRPAGYTVETPDEDEAISWFRKILVPVLLLLFGVLAVTFESLTLPFLVLLALPLTILGAVWALVFAGMPADLMALVGALALIGLTVNPAILLVDRMQQRVRTSGIGAGAAAVAAVRERVRPVLMTVSTTVAGLWPLALVTGRENEIWPPFATIVMGGLVTSTLLTLLVVPVGFVALHRLDRTFGRLGPWIVLGWIGATAAVMTPLIVTDTVSSLTWRIITTVLVAALFLGGAALVLRRPDRPEPRSADGEPPVLEVRHLDKTYGRPGPVGRAWRLPQRFAQRVLEQGGRPFDPRDARERVPPLALLLAGGLYLAVSLQTAFWRSVFSFVAAALAAAAFREIRRARGKADEVGRVAPGGVENLLAFLAPWVALGWIVMDLHVLPQARGDRARLPLWLLITTAVVLAIVQLGRRTAVRLARGDIPETLAAGRLRRLRSVWRAVCRRLFGLDLPREEVRALRGVNFQATSGMIGILGPNGAGKTTLLRQLTGILDPSSGTIWLGGVRLERLRRHLARWVGYLPQDFGLPRDLTARQYLDYYARLYEIRPASRRRERVTKLLEEVGLGERAGERIGSFSGGMRQRVAVARTLLRLPSVIVVDEPTVGLDPRERIRFRNLLARLAEGRIVLFSTHVVEDVAVACGRVIVFARGRIVFDGLPEQLAGRAEGRVWELHLQPGQAELPEAKIVDQVPEESGLLRSRVLAASRPGPAARAMPPTLEDGYLWLVSMEAA